MPCLSFDTNIWVLCFAYSAWTFDSETMEEWDQEMLEKVVESKKNEYNQNKPTEIVCPFSFYNIYIFIYIYMIQKWNFF